MVRGTGSGQVYRAPMRSRLPRVDPELALERALRLGLCGIGGRLPAPPGSWAEALAATDATYDERTAARLERFAAVPDGAEVWSRDVLGGLRRGRLTGPWRYDASPAAWEADLVHVRDCDWRPGNVDRAGVPAPVLATFARGGLNFQRIRAL